MGNAPWARRLLPPSSRAWSQTFVLSFLPILLAVDTVTSDYALPAIGARSGLSPIRKRRANRKKEGAPGWHVLLF